MPSREDLTFRAAAHGQLDKLLPVHERVVEKFHEQRYIDQSHVNAQQAYLDSGLKVEAGAHQHELSNFAEARRSFREAEQAAQMDIHDKHHEYHFGASGLSLGQYSRLFAIRREGILKLISASDSTMNERKRRMEFSAGLDCLFEARQLVVD